MHSILLGVVKQIWELCTGSSNHTKPYYVGLRLEEIDRRMQSIRTPSFFSRYPGKIEDMKKNKAYDWENILFHFFYPCVVDILPNKYLNNFMLLSTCIFKLLDIHLSNETINIVEKQLDKFVLEFQKLYGKENMYFNIHIVTHLAECAKNFGALWNSSLYPYENGNGMILKFRTGNNHPVVQITNKFVLNKICHNTSLITNNSIKKWHSHIWHPKKTHQLTFCNQQLYQCSNELIIDEDILVREFSCHVKVTYDGIQYCTRKYCEELGYDDSFVKICNDFFRIDHVLTDTNDNVYIVGVKLITRFIFDNMLVYEYSDQYHLKHITNVRPCVSISIVKDNVVINYISQCKPRTQID